MQPEPVIIIGQAGRRDLPGRWRDHRQPHWNAGPESDDAQNSGMATGIPEAPAAGIFRPGRNVPRAHSLGEKTCIFKLLRAFYGLD